MSTRAGSNGPRVPPGWLTPIRLCHSVADLRFVNSAMSYGAKRVPENRGVEGCRCNGRSMLKNRSQIGWLASRIFGEVIGARNRHFPFSQRCSFALEKPTREQKVRSPIIFGDIITPHDAIVAVGVNHSYAGFDNTDMSHQSRLLRGIEEEKISRLKRGGHRLTEEGLRRGVMREHDVHLFKSRLGQAGTIEHIRADRGRRALVGLADLPGGEINRIGCIT